MLRLAATTNHKQLAKKKKKKAEAISTIKNDTSVANYRSTYKEAIVVGTF